MCSWQEPNFTFRCVLSAPIADDNCTSGAGLGPCGWQGWSLPTPVCSMLKPKWYKTRIKYNHSFQVADCHFGGSVPYWRRFLLHACWGIGTPRSFQAGGIGLQNFSAGKTLKIVQSSEPGTQLLGQLSPPAASHETADVTSTVGSPLGISRYPSSAASVS